MARKAKIKQSKVVARTQVSGLPRFGTSGTIVAPRWRIEAAVMARTNSTVRQALTSIVKAEKKAAQAKANAASRAVSPIVQDNAAKAVV